MNVSRAEHWLYLFFFLLVVGCDLAQTSAERGEASTVTLPGWDEGSPRLELEVPDGYTTRTSEGRDFDVHFLVPSSSGGATGSIYVGHNPSAYHRRLGDSEAVAEREEIIGGELVKVYEFVVQDANAQLYVREAILTGVFADIPRQKELQELRVHISASASTADELDKIWKCVAGVRHE